MVCMPCFMPEKPIIQLQMIIIHVTKNLGRFKTVFGNTNAQLGEFICCLIDIVYLNLPSHLIDRKL